MTSKPAYDDVPDALKDCKDIINFFQSAYAVDNANVRFRHNTSTKEITSIYSKSDLYGILQ